MLDDAVAERQPRFRVISQLLGGDEPALILHAQGDSAGIVVHQRDFQRDKTLLERLGVHPFLWQNGFGAASAPHPNVFAPDAWQARCNTRRVGRARFAGPLLSIS